MEASENFDMLEDDQEQIPSTGDLEVKSQLMTADMKHSLLRGPKGEQKNQVPLQSLFPVASEEQVGKSGNFRRPPAMDEEFAEFQTSGKRMKFA